MSSQSLLIIKVVSFTILMLHKHLGRHNITVVLSLLYLEHIKEKSRSFQCTTHQNISCDLASGSGSQKNLLYCNLRKRPLENHLSCSNSNNLRNDEQKHLSLLRKRSAKVLKTVWKHKGGNLICT